MGPPSRLSSVAPGYASRMGEWLAIRNCARPPASRSWMILRNESCRCGESAASGSSRRYMPRSKRLGESAVPFQGRDLVEVGREIVEARRSHEEAVRHLRLPGEPERAGQIGGIGPTVKMMIASAALGVEAAAFRPGPP